MSVSENSGRIPKIMAHLVAGFPDEAGALAAARALVEGGASYLEIQFPFSDPSADGPTIQDASARSIGAGFTVAKGFAFVEKLVHEFGIPVFIMSYGSLVFARGVDRFCADAKAAGATGLIIPDLCPGADEGLYGIGAACGLDIVPVIAPGIGNDRLKEILLAKSSFIYAALRTGITGSQTEIDPGNIALLRAAASLGAKVLAGFGISGREQMLALGGSVHAAVVGSAFVRVIASEGRKGELAIRLGVLAKIKELRGA